MNDFRDDDLDNDTNQGEGYAELDRLFAVARQPTPEDLGAAERFLAGRTLAAGSLAARITGRQITGRQTTGRQWHRLRLWASAALGVAAAVGGLMLLRPAPAELPASAAYSVYQSALGEGW